MNYIFSFLFPILLLAMGGYVLFSAIKGEGKLFSTENFKEESKDQAKKIMRLLYFALAAIMLILAITNTFSTVLYTNKVSYFRITEEYKKAFPDLISENGQLLKLDVSGEKAVFEKDSEGNFVEQNDGKGNKEAYNIANQKMDQTVAIGGFVQNAYYMHGQDTAKFPQVSSGGMLSCMSGTSVKYDQYYEMTDALDESGEPIYDASKKSSGHVAYLSMFSNTRSDEKSDKFVVKLYNAFGQKLLTILNYVFLGLAVVCVIALFLVTRKFTDKEKLQKAREQQVRPSMPSDAFDFDDEEPKQNTTNDNK